MTVAEAKKRFIEIAENELGYYEKASDKDLDIKDANKGTAGFTKYARDLDSISYYCGSVQGNPWCAAFVDWCMWKLVNENKEQAYTVLMRPNDGSNGSCSCTTTVGYYKKNKSFYYTDPQVGDQIFFTNNKKEIVHTGIVKEVRAAKNKVITIEGNSSAKVKENTYSLDNTTIYGYGRPLWKTMLGVSATPASKSKTDFSTSIYDTLSADAKNVVKTIVTYLRGQGLDDHAIAGICGNAYAESSFNPIVVQGHTGDNAFNKKYTQDVNTGVIKRNEFKGNERTGYGLFQFTTSGKRLALYDAAFNNGLTDVGNINTQCKVLIDGLSTPCGYLRYTGNMPTLYDWDRDRTYLKGNFLTYAKNIKELPTAVEYGFTLMPTNSKDIKHENLISFFTNAMLSTYEIPSLKYHDVAVASWNNRFNMAKAIYQIITTTLIKGSSNTYYARLSSPKDDGVSGKYYKSPEKGGINNADCIPPLNLNTKKTIGCPVNFDVLPNCVGYARGRFLEIYGATTTPSDSFINQNPPGIWSSAKNGLTLYGTTKLTTGSEPQVGALICWRKNEEPDNGHIAVVEEILDKDKDGKAIKIKISESHYFDDDKYTTDKSAWWYNTWYDNREISKSGATWPAPYGLSWGTFLGFIYHPKYQKNGNFSTLDIEEFDSSDSGSGSGSSADWTNSFGSWPPKYGDISNKYTVVEKEISKNVLSTNIKTIDYNGELQRTKSTGLLSYPTLVESPYISVTIGNYTFGSYNKKQEYSNTPKLTKLIEYPNFLNGIDVIKINGAINKYTISMVYQIRPGDDPNFLDKILSSVKDFRKIKISYGDSASPSFLFKEEEALITKVDSNVDFSESRIIYTLHCTSTAVKSLGNSMDWHAVPSAQPSELIISMLTDKNDKYGLRAIFPIMGKKDTIYENGWIARNDRAVRIEAKKGLDPLSYINYLVTCMVSNDSDPNYALNKSSYYLTLVDDIYNNSNSPYFTVKEIKSNSYTIHSNNMYDVDVGYPGEIENNRSNLIMSFTINTDNSWALFYNYQEKMSMDNYTYSIDDDGNLITEYSPAITTSTRTNNTNAAQKAWWTNMTQYPITATLIIKGLVRPTLLMSYIRVNSLFFGQRHISSGIYIITKQEDKIDRSGYRTILTLKRIAGDLDYIETKEVKVTSTVKRLKRNETNKKAGLSADVKKISDMALSVGLQEIQKGVDDIIVGKKPEDLSDDDSKKLAESTVATIKLQAQSWITTINTGNDAVATGDQLFGNVDGNGICFMDKVYDILGQPWVDAIISEFNSVYKTDIGSDMYLNGIHLVNTTKWASTINNKEWYKQFIIDAKLQNTSEIFKNSSVPEKSRHSKLVSNGMFVLSENLSSLVDESYESVVNKFSSINIEKLTTESAKKNYLSFCNAVYLQHLKISNTVGFLRDKTNDDVNTEAKWQDIEQVISAHTYSSYGLVGKYSEYLNKVEAISEDIYSKTSDAFKDKLDSASGYFDESTYDCIIAIGKLYYSNKKLFN